MSNVLKVSLQTTIYSLAQRGWSRRRIAKELGINRETVGRYLRLPKPAISITGNLAGKEESKPAISIAGTGAGRRSRCEGLAEVIAAKVEVGLSGQRIYQDLVEQNGFSDSYQWVQRFVRKLKGAQPQRVWRMEARPSEEVQVDFGLGAPIWEGPSRPRRSWVFRMVLSYSRKAYSEAVLRQDTETFLRCLENGLRAFGGVPLLLNLDNLKAAVLKADWFDPEINPKLADFCRHYRIHVMPCRPYKPQHKGKVERGVAYLRANALKGRRFKSLAEENLFLEHWESQVADKRIHGTTRKQVAACFEQERPYLQPLPDSLFPSFQEARRSVHRDSYVEVARAYYGVPAELIGHQVWVRWDSRCVRVFNQQMEQVQIHSRVEPGRFSHVLGARGLHAPVISSCRYWISRAAVIGEQCGQWAQGAFELRGAESLRSIMGLCALIKQHSATAINTACSKALKAGVRATDRRNGKNRTLRSSKDHSTKRERSRTRLQLVFTAKPVLEDQLSADRGSVLAWQ
ncbi:MAG TPA: IS21 family transposase [Chthoniobacterales bacterium]|nr:IS21 family transposase [Chthoniobacterales bacterium]